ncbi:MAG: transposase, partial [Ferruginibacter sp.]
LMNLLEEVKKRSSKWIKTQGAVYAKFYWRCGYGAFSANATETDEVVRYIEPQHQHHQTMNFQNEYGASLKKYRVVFDERYVWN